MSEEKLVCTNELTIRFEQYDNGQVLWSIVPDEEVWKTKTLSLIDLAECGAPLSALGIRALWKLCMDGLIFHSLEEASSITKEINKRLLSGPVQAQLDLAPEGVTIN